MDVEGGPPEDYANLGILSGMSNFDHTVDEGFEDALKAEKVYGRHSGWHFNGEVWWDGTEFRERVWVHRMVMKTVAASSLKELMALVNDEFGWE